MGTMLDGEIYMWSFEGHNNTNISYYAIFYDFQVWTLIVVLIVISTFFELWNPFGISIFLENIEQIL